MPPNRKAELSAENLPTLDVHTLLLNKNLPSDATSAVTADQLEAPPTADEYWTWTVDPNVASLQAAETARRLTSVDHIQQNLIEAAALAQSPRTIAQAASHSQASQQDYWDMPSTAPKSNEIPEALYQYLQKSQESNTATDFTHTQLEYWDWPAGSSKVERDEQCLHRVLDATRARHLTSATMYEQHLIRERDAVTVGSATRVAVPPVVTSTLDGMQGYWDF